MKKIHYRVQSGDSLPSIARRHNIPEDVLSRMNGISDLNPVRPGLELQIPQESQSTQRALTQSRADRVQANDKTLADIAQRNNVTVQALAQANGISDPDEKLVFGLKLKIPPVRGSGTAKDNQATKGADGKFAPFQKKAGEQQASSPEEEVKWSGTPQGEIKEYKIKIPPGTSSKEEFRHYAETYIFGRVVNYPWKAPEPGLSKIYKNIANHVGTEVPFHVEVSDLALYGSAEDAAVKAERQAGEQSYAALSSADRARINEEIDRRYSASEGSPFGKKIKPNELGKIAIWNSFKQQVMAEKRKLDALKISPDDAIVLATSTLELASRALEGGQGEVAANILKEGAAELESPATAASSSTKPILDAILGTMKARAAGYLQTAPRPQAEKAFELITLSKKVKAVGKGLKRNSEHAKLLEELATDSLVQAEFLLHAADNTEVMIGRGISQTYRAIVNTCFDKRIDESGTLNNLFTNNRDKLQADKTKINEVFDYVDRKMDKAGLSFDRVWSAMFNEHHLVEKKGPPVLSDRARGGRVPSRS
ncbi:MAG TPA: LysM peptidoglycan-binding domain-containing protein [Archangium sp.]|nr:LysM peptidoglycan-binding domain-containing protein [Archangium sp.]